MKTISILLLILILAGCGGAEDKKASYFEKAQQSYDTGDYDKARIELQNVLQIDPKDIPARYLLGQVMEKLQDFRAAAGQYNAILEQDDTHLRSNIRLGQFYLLAKDINKAKELADRALTLVPGDSEALAFRGSIHLAQENFQLAHQDAESALESDPENINAILLKSTALNRMNLNNEAISVLTTAQKQFPDNSLLTNSLANIFAERKQFAQAAEQMTRLIDNNPEALFNYLRLSEIYFAAGEKDKSESTLRNAAKQFPDNNQVKFAIVKLIAEEQGQQAAIDELKAFISSNPDNYVLQFELARIYQTTGKPDEAIAIYEKVIANEQLQPDGLRSRVLLADLYTRIGKNDLAEPLLAEVLAESQNDQAALALRGQLSLQKKDYVAAIADFRAAMRDQPNSITLSRYLANAHFLNNEADLARDTIKRAINLNKTDLSLRQDLIRLLAVENDIDGVTEQLNDVLQFAPDNIAAMQALFRINAAEKNWQALTNITNQMKASNPDKPIGYYYAGMLSIAQDKPEDSISEFEKANQLAPNAVEPVTQLVRTYLGLKQTDKALAKLNSILEQNPDSVFAQNLKGEVFLSENNLDKASAAFTKAIEINKEFYLPYRNLARIYISEKKNKQAIEVYRQGIDATGNATVLVSDLARFYEVNGETDNAIQLYEDLLLKEPENQLAINNLAMLLIDYKGDEASLSRAETLAEKLAGNDNPAYLDTIGWLKYKQGEYLEAVSLLEKAVAAAPDNAGLNYHLGMAYFKAGQQEAAKQALIVATKEGENYLGINEAQDTLKNL